MKINLIIILFTFSYASVDLVKATIIAENVIIERTNNNYAIKNFILDSTEDIDNFYIFNLEPIGFVIVSAHESIIPLIGYSFNKNFSYNDIPPQLSQIFDSYRKNISMTIEYGLEPNVEINVLWNKYFVFYLAFY